MIKVVIEVRFTSFVVYVIFVTGQYSTLTVSWITKQQFVGASVVWDDADGNEGLVESVGAIRCQLSGAKKVWLNILGEVESATVKVMSVAKRIIRLRENITRSECKDCGYT